ncbi:helix-turn-helix domain-containing protein [Macrococcus equi]|uniref:helix-turn-helix domain-containing protein n=1 Tax=Macrococcus equi TaxID=3395462 RepID=UPI0039BDB431
MGLLANERSLRIAMLMKGFSIRELAGLAGLNESYLSQIVNGRRSPSAKAAREISRLLEKEVSELFNINEKEAMQ